MLVYDLVSILAMPKPVRVASLHSETPLYVEYWTLYGRPALSGSLFGFSLLRGATGATVFDI